MFTLWLNKYKTPLKVQTRIILWLNKACYLIRKCYSLRPLHSDVGKKETIMCTESYRGKSLKPLKWIDARLDNARRCRVNGMNDSGYRWVTFPTHFDQHSFYFQTVVQVKGCRSCFPVMSFFTIKQKPVGGSYQSKMELCAGGVEGLSWGFWYCFCKWTKPKVQNYDPREVLCVCVCVLVCTCRLS